MNNWESDIKNWKNLSKDTMSFFLNQSEAYLEETVKTFENISKKTNHLLTISITLTTISLGYLLDFDERNMELKIAAMLLALISASVIIKLRKNLFFDKLGVKGSQPKHVIKDKFFTENLSSNEQYNNLIFNECERYQARIDSNTVINKRRKKRVEFAINLLLSIPLTIPVAKIIAIIFCH